MTKEELEKEATEWVRQKFPMLDLKQSDMPKIHEYEAYIAGAEPRDKRIAELEEKISILLSCNSCPDNKGGYICQKEYENKCLAQKIQYIKELKEENAELKKIEEEYYDFIQKKNEEDWKGDNVVSCLKLKIEQLKAQIEKMKCCDKDGTRSNHCVKCKNFSNWELDKE